LDLVRSAIDFCAELDEFYEGVEWDSILFKSIDMLYYESKLLGVLVVRVRLRLEFWIYIGFGGRLLRLAV